MRRAAATCVVLLFAPALTLLSVSVQRVGPEQAVVGNLCGPAMDQLCYAEVLHGGFPFSYLFDNPNVSVPDQLGFGEDDFRSGAFILDVLIYSLALLHLYSLRRSAGR